MSILIGDKSDLCIDSSLLQVSQTQLSQCSLLYMKVNRSVVVVAIGLSLLIKKGLIMSKPAHCAFWLNFTGIIVLLS